MRVTDKMGFEQVTRNLGKNRGELSELQNQAATQKRINKPSDDPIAAARVLGARTEERGSSQFLKNINIARSFLEFSDQSLAELTESLMRVKELAIQQSNDAGSNQDTRRAVAEEINQIFNQTVQIGNRKLGERFIFGGFQTTMPPFSPEGQYQGDDGDLKIHVNKDTFMAMNLPGDGVFLGRGISEDGMIRPKAQTPKTAEQLGEYENSEKERVEQNRLHDQQDSSSPLILRAPAGQSSRMQKDVETKIPGTGEGGVNVLQALKDFEIGLRVGDKGTIQESIDKVDQALAQVIHARSQIGARVQVLNHTTESLQKAVVDDKVVGSQLEDADLFQVASDIAKTDSTLKATLETSGRVVQPSLLDFLK